MPNGKVIKVPVKKKTKLRVKDEFSEISKSIRIHKDSSGSRERMAKHFNGQYTKQELDSMAFMWLEETVKALNLGKGDNVFQVLGI